MVNIVLLLTNGDIKNLVLNLKPSESIKNVESIIQNKLLKSKLDNAGDGKLNKIGEWNIEDFKLIAFGYLKGKKKLLNNHELLSNNKIKTSTYYGDIVMCKTSTNHVLDELSCDQYESLYMNHYNNEQDVNSEDNDSEFGSDSDMDELIEGVNLDNDLNDDLDDLEDQIDDEIEELDSDNECVSDDDISPTNEDADDEDDINDIYPVTINKISKKKNKKNHNDDWTDWNYVKQETNFESNDDELDIVDETEIINNEYNDKRYKVIDLLKELVSEDVALKIENSILDSICNQCKLRKIVIKWDNNYFYKMYINKCRSIYSNINDNSYIKNNYLLENIKNKNIDPESIGSMTYQALFPNHWKILLDKKYKKQEELYEKKQEAMTDEFKCKRCKSRKTSYFELQTRSADEPMTIFINCLTCGNRWKN